MINAPIYLRPPRKIKVLRTTATCMSRSWMNRLCCLYCSLSGCCLTIFVPTFKKLQFAKLKSVEAFAKIDLEASCQELLSFFTEVIRDFRIIVDLRQAIQSVHFQMIVVVVFQGKFEREHLVDYASEAPDVALAMKLLLSEQLRRDVAGSSLEISAVYVSDVERCSEVSKLHDAFTRDETVPAFHVPVHHAMSVEVGQSLCQVPCESSDHFFLQFASDIEKV
mmetsp:Transcript_19147/g.43939  ORF Transcript_19147/g.43939 Transcript_19147/m.43939 type:complete len:222 (+) Transcript_19147:1008-1673(+)